MRFFLRVEKKEREETVHSINRKDGDSRDTKRDNKEAYFKIQRFINNYTLLLGK